MAIRRVCHVIFGNRKRAKHVTPTAQDFLASLARFFPKLGGVSGKTKHRGQATVQSRPERKVSDTVVFESITKLAVGASVSESHLCGRSLLAALVVEEWHVPR